MKSERCASVREADPGPLESRFRVGGFSAEPDHPAARAVKVCSLPAEPASAPDPIGVPAVMQGRDERVGTRCRRDPPESTGAEAPCLVAGPIRSGRWSDQEPELGP